MKPPYLFRGPYIKNIPYISLMYIKMVHLINYHYHYYYYKISIRTSKKSPRTMRLQRVPRGQCIIIRKTRKKTKKTPPKTKTIIQIKYQLEKKKKKRYKNYISSKYLLISDLKLVTLESVTIFSGHSFQILIDLLKKFY